MSNYSDHEGGTVIATFARELPSFLQSHGQEIEPFAKAVGLNPKDFSDLNNRISLDAFCRLLSALSTVLNQETLGIEYGRYRTGGASGAFGQGFVSAPTIKHMLMFYTQYLNTVVDQRFYEAVFEKESVSITWDYSPLVSNTDQFVDAAVFSFMKVINAATDGRQEYISFELKRQRPKNPADYRKAYPGKVTFKTPLNRIVLSTSQLSSRNPYANEVLFELMSAECDRQLAHSQASKPLVTRLKEEILETLESGHLSISEAANQVGMSARTLQRRLKQHDLTFDSLVEQVRFDLIERKLGDTTDPLGQIAYAVGYSDQSSFTRAVIKKHGCSPSQLRRQLQTTGDST